MIDSYGASFLTKARFDKTNNTKTKAIYLNFKILKLKIKVTLPWILLYLRQQLFTNKDFCMKTRLCYNFVTANAMALTKARQKSHISKAT